MRMPLHPGLVGVGVISAATVIALASARQQPSANRLDVLIAGGRLVDGTGSPWFQGDVGIVGDRIAAVGPPGSLGPAGGNTAALTIDATGLVVAPGFIDLLGQSEFNVLVDNRAASKILQGV